MFSSPQRSLILSVYTYTLTPALITVRVQLLSCVQLLGTPWTAGQASLSFTHCRNLLEFMFVESVMVSNHLNLCHPLLFWPSILPSIRVISKESFLYHLAKIVCLWDSPSKNTGVGCPFLLQGIFLTQRSTHVS